MAYYNPGFQSANPYQQQLMNQAQQMMNPQPQIQNSGLIPAPNEAYALNYPVAPGNSVSFISEDKNYLFVKTMGLSQFDQPNFEKFRLVKEEDPAEAPQDYALKSDLEALRDDIEILKLKSMMKESE